MVDFRHLDRVVSRAVDTAFGGRISVLPRVVAGPYGDPGPDATRPAKILTGHFASAPDMTDIRGGTIGGDGRGGTKFAVAPTAVLVTAVNYATLGYELRKGDHVVMLDEPGTPLFEVVKAPHRQGEDVQIILARNGEQAP